MKAVAWFTILLSIELVMSLNKSSIASLAINAILNEFFVPFSSSIDLIYFGPSNYQANSVTPLLRIKNDSLSIRVFNNELDPWTNILNTSSILLFNSEKTFKQKILSITWQSDKKVRHKHIIHYPNETISDLTETVKDGFAVDSVAFLVNETEKSIDLVTSFMFSPGHCRSNQFKKINRFNKSNMRWKNSNFFPNKYRNLHGCTLELETDSGNGPHFSYKILSNGSIEISGYTYEIIAALAHETKFEIKLTFVAIDDFGKNSNDLIALSYPFLYENSIHIMSAAYLYSEIVFLIPPGELYTPLEKMFLIFDLDVWLMIIVTFLIALGTIQIINRTSKRIQIFVYGEQVNTPTLNIASTFLIGNQTVMPVRDFARFLLMLFIIWSLIIRTCYQSELFKYMQKDLRKPEVKTIEELIEQDFTLCHKPEDAVFIKNVIDEIIQKKFKILELEAGPFFSEANLVSKPEMKRTMLTPKTLLQFAHNKFRSGFSSLLVLEEKIVSIGFGLVFRAFSPFYETFNEKILRMIEGGLTTQWIQNALNQRGVNKKLPDIGPEVLTMEHLDISFKIIILALAVSIMGFLAEIIFYRFKMHLKKYH